jgi:hypothetical protein
MMETGWRGLLLQLESTVTATGIHHFAHITVCLLCVCICMSFDYECVTVCDYVCVTMCVCVCDCVCVFGWVLLCDCVTV